MTWVAIQATTPRDAYWKLTQAFFTAGMRACDHGGPFYVLNNPVLEMSQPGVVDLTPADGHFTIHRWRKYPSYNRYRILGKALRRKRAGTIREKIVPELILKDRGTHGLEDS